jgi:anti-sigma regulatory factor (Ser/Thr protein kinase)
MHSIVFDGKNRTACPMESHTYSFELKSDLSELETLCQHLKKFGQVTGLSQTCATDINICLDELFTNIVSYGFDDDQEHKIRFTINLDNNVLIFKIEDDGVPFNPLKKKDPEFPADIMDARIGGLGIHIVRKLMDDIRYQRKRGRNSLTMKKHL